MKMKKWIACLIMWIAILTQFTGIAINDTYLWCMGVGAWFVAFTWYMIEIATEWMKNEKI